MFRGEYQHSIDAKGRIAIPAKFRVALAQGIVLVRGLEGCVYGYALAVWEEKERALNALDIPTVERNKIQRRFISTAQDCELDAQGRIVVPPVMRRHASLTSEATIAGTGERFEIWDRARWQVEIDEIAGEDFSAYHLPF
jgi:MraZ protein